MTKPTTNVGFLPADRTARQIVYATSHGFISLYKTL